MIIHYVSVGGNDRPVCFSNALAYHFELTTGKSYLSELALLFTELGQVASRSGTVDVGVAAAQISVVRFVDIMHSAFVLGARQERIQVDFDQYDVADWLMSDSTAVAQLANMLAEANIDPAAQKKTMKPTTATTSKKPAKK